MPSHTAHDPLRYPIGRPPQADAPGLRSVDAIRDLPQQFAAALSGLSDSQLDTAYRPGGWTLRQLAHHVADSHMNAYVRLRFALTEEWPTIKPYEEARWGELADARTAPVEVSLALLVPLHARWVALLDSLTDADWQRGYVHPENGRTTIQAMTRLYDWHGRHHTAHALGLRERMGWSSGKLGEKQVEIDVDRRPSTTSLRLSDQALNSEEPR